MKRTALALILLLAPLFAALPSTQKEEVKPLDLKQKDKVAQKEYATGYVPLTPERRAHFQAISRARHGNRIQYAAKNLALPTLFDCRARFPLPTWDQGSCGSCYLVSTVRTMTNAGLMVGAGKPDGSYMLSSQYGMDRPRDFGGCNGGNGTEVIDWVIRNGWIAEKYTDISGVAHVDYPPYEARSGSDRTKAGAKVWCKDWTWGFVNPNGNPSVDEIKAAMYLHGRLNIALDAGGQFGSGTGTITALGRSINHEINLIGWDDSKDGGAFLMENQWGNEWGVNGCRWITYKAAANIVDHFWVSAGTVPPDPTPPGTVIVPALTGKSLVDAVAALKASGLALSSTTGDLTKVVVSQVPTAGTSVAANSGVALTFGDTPLPPTPGKVVITLTPEQVQSVIQQSGVVIITPQMTLQQVLDAFKKTQEK